MTRYVDANNSPTTLSFGLGKDVAVNAIIGTTTLRSWGCSIDFVTNHLSASLIRTRFPLKAEKATSSLPSHVKFIPEDFIRPRQTTPEGKAFLMSMDADNITITDGSQVTTEPTGPLVLNRNENGFLQCSLVPKQL